MGSSYNIGHYIANPHFRMPPSPGKPAILENEGSGRWMAFCTVYATRSGTPDEKRNWKLNWTREERARGVGYPEFNSVLSGG